MYLENSTAAPANNPASLYNDASGKADTAALSAAQKSGAHATGQTSGDSVQISDRARALAAPLDLAKLNFSVVKTFTAQNNDKVTLETAVNEQGETIARLTFKSPDGTERSEILSESAVLRRNDSGGFDVIPYDTSEQTLQVVNEINVVGRGKYYFEKYVRNIEGGEGDDIIVLLPAKGLDKEVIWNVDAGNGDNIVIDLANTRSNIRTGSGKDIIIGLGDGRWGKGFAAFDVDSGDGDDVIDLTGGWASVKAGGGNDVINLKVDSAYLVDGGDGDDIINIDTNLGVRTVIGGAGSNTIHITGNVHNAKIYGGSAPGEGDEEGQTGRTGDGHNVITITGDASHSEIHGGNGGSAINVDSAFFSKIYGGDGNDDITIDRAFMSFIDAGDGDDTVRVRDLASSTLLGGGGQDKIIIDMAAGSLIDGGDGDDEIRIRDLHGGQVMGGAGQNTIDVKSSYEAEIWADTPKEEKKGDAAKAGSDKDAAKTGKDGASENAAGEETAGLDDAATPEVATPENPAAPKSGSESSAAAPSQTAAPEVELAPKAGAVRPDAAPATAAPAELSDYEREIAQGAIGVAKGRPAPAALHPPATDPETEEEPAPPTAPLAPLDPANPDETVYAQGYLRPKRHRSSVSLTI